MTPRLALVGVALLCILATIGVNAAALSRTTDSGGSNHAHPDHAIVYNSPLPIGVDPFKVGKAAQAALASAQGANGTTAGTATAGVTILGIFEDSTGQRAAELQGASGVGDLKHVGDDILGSTISTIGDDGVHLASGLFIPYDRFSAQGNQTPAVGSVLGGVGADALFHVPGGADLAMPSPSPAPSHGPQHYFLGPVSQPSPKG